MADSARNKILSQADEKAQNSPPTPVSDSKTNWIKDLAIPVLAAILGFVFGISQDILKHEYEYRSNTPRVRYVESTKAITAVQGQYMQETSTIVYPVGRAVVPTLVIRATADSEDIHLVDDQAASEPAGQHALVSQMENLGRTDWVRTLVIHNFHEPQRVTWTVKATSSTEGPRLFVDFDYSGPSDIHDGKYLPWTEKISAVSIAAVLLCYSSITTALALYFRWKGR